HSECQWREHSLRPLPFLNPFSSLSQQESLCLAMRHLYLLCPFLPMASCWAGPRPSMASCWQPGTRTSMTPGVSEDCLYLNVFIPQNVAHNASVLVFFHNTMDGEESEGWLAIDGSFLAAVGNLIVVTASYRVGVFGFLSSGSGEVSGNWGLLDQVAALTWVQTHIRGFGGDPQRVSLAADRGGADVASIHLLT
ncbi:TG isoform 9, partial [Pongo abelii]